MPSSARESIDNIFEKMQTIYCDIFDTIEVNFSYDITKIQPQLDKLSYTILRNSDAHLITDILEPVETIELANLDIEALFSKLKERKHG